MRRIATRLLVIATLLSASIGLTGCFGYSEAEYLDMINQWLADHDQSEEGLAENGEGALPEGVTLELTYPAGASPNVFTTGWVFGARCTVEDEGGTRDLSGDVRWSGSGSFSPATGSTSRPAFNGAGANTITLSVDVGGTTAERTFNVSAVEPFGYAAVGDQARGESHGHGCPACPHPPSIGPIISGSPNVFVGNRPAARVGDTGVSPACCGPNTFEITGGDSSVMINGRPAAQIGSPTTHCGAAPGTIVTGN